MSVLRAEFLMVRTDDINRLRRKLRQQETMRGGGLHWETGIVAAMILAAVKYATQLPNGPGRLTLDGHVWWQATQADIAQSIGLRDAKDRYRVMRIVQKLQVAGELKVCWPTASEDRTKAYRLPDEKAADQPMCANEHGLTSQCAQTADQCAQTDESMCANGNPTMSLKNLKKKEKVVRERAGEPPDRIAVPGFADDPQKNSSQKQKQKPAPDAASPDADGDDKKPRPQLGSMIHRLLKTTNPDNTGGSVLSPHTRAAIDAARANLDAAQEAHQDTA